MPPSKLTHTLYSLEGTLAVVRRMKRAELVVMGPSFSDVPGTTTGLKLQLRCASISTAKVLPFAKPYPEKVMLTPVAEAASAAPTWVGDMAVAMPCKKRSPPVPTGREKSRPFMGPPKSTQGR